MGAGEPDTTANRASLQSPPPFVRGTSAVVASGIVQAITHPLDVLKTRLAASSYSDLKLLGPEAGTGYGWNGQHQVSGRWRAAVRSIWNGGYRVWMAGLGASLSGSLSYKFAYFAVYGHAKDMFLPYYHLAVASAMAGGVAATSVNFLINPLFVLRTRAQLEPVATNMFKLMGRVVEQEGWKGLYRGAGIGLIGRGMESVVFWPLYEMSKEWRGLGVRWGMGAGPGSNDGHVRNIVGLFLSAAGAKGVATLITYPHIVIQVHLREVEVTKNNGTKIAEPRFKGIWATSKWIVESRGIKGLYGGLSAHLLRGTINNGLRMSMLECILSGLGYSM